MHCTVLKICCLTLDKHFITWLRVQWRLCLFNWSIKHKSIDQAASDYNQQLHVKQMTQQTRLPLIKNISRPDETTNRFVRTGGNERQLVHISSVYKLHSYISGNCVSLSCAQDKLTLITCHYLDRRMSQYESEGLWDYYCSRESSNI